MDTQYLKSNLGRAASTCADKRSLSILIKIRTKAIYCISMNFSAVNVLVLAVRYLIDSVLVGNTTFCFALLHRARESTSPMSTMGADSGVNKPSICGANTTVNLLLLSKINIVILFQNLFCSSAGLA